MDKPIIMGRKTHESIGRALPGRVNIVVSRDPAYTAEGCVTALGIDDALRVAGNVQEVMIVGGAGLYDVSLEFADKLYLTEVHADVGGDVTFPAFDRNAWREVAREDHDASDAQAYAFSFVTLEKIKPSPRQ